MRASTGSRIFRASSGSRAASSSIEPLRSAKRTVTCLRSPSSEALEVRVFSAGCLGVCLGGELNRGAAGVGAKVSDLPQPPQNFSLPSFRKSHDRHAEANESPHSLQKRRPSRFSARHRGHCIAPLPRAWGGEGRSGGPRVAGSSQPVKDVYSSSTLTTRLRAQVSVADHTTQLPENTAFTDKFDLPRFLYRVR